MEDPSDMRYAVKVLHYTTPLIVLAYWAIAALVSVIKLQDDDTSVRKKLRWSILSVMVAVTITFVSEAGLIITQIFTNPGPLVTTSGNIYALSGSLLWIMLSCSVLILDKNQWYPFFGAWILAFIFETLIVTLTLDHMRPSRPLEHVQVALEFVRVGLLALLLAVFFSLRGYRHSVDEEETAPLLASSHESSAGSDGRQSGFGTIGSNASDESAAASANEEALAKEEKKQNERYAKLQEKVRQNGNWWTYLREYRIFVPLIWPTGKPLLQVYMVIVGICVLAGRAFAILVPRQLGILTTSLAHGQLHSSFVALAIYVGLRALRSDAGLEGLRSILWNSVESNAFQTLETASFNHIMDLSCDFHDEKQSGELYTAMTQGAALVRLLDVLLYHIGPTSLDLLLACIYFYFLMDAYLVLIGGAVATFYYATSLYIAAYQRRLWRQSNVLNRRKYQIQYDTMGGWRTVTYFNRIPHAQTIYATVVKLYRSFRVKANQIEQLQDGFQTLILNFGAFTAFTLGVYRVAKGKSEVGDFITLVMYWDTFLGKLPYFAHMQQDFLRRLVDAEELLRLFQKQPSVQDGPNEFNLQQGGVVFEDVTFTYNDKKNIVNDLSFHAEPGQTIALIGETGAGKSTILKLLFRLYDVNEGSIKIDGQDVRDVTLGSLREHIGVVPQDPSLFNDTIMANVRFARLDATDEEVMEACKSACIHDKILTFTDGYDSKVGERGQKLSGGELQRVAIARAILKNPRIILLDEATSSVDTETEANIQQALKKLVTGRTTFVVAHRLSTVTDADRILVIKDGTILEQGHPKELFKSRGKYYSLCSKQMGILDASEDHGSSEGSESRGASSSASKKSLAGTRTPSRDTGDQRTTNETGTSDKKSTDELSEERISRTGQSSQPQSDKSASRGSSDNDGAMTGNKTPIDQTASKQSSSGNTSRKMSIGGEDERRKSASSGPASKKSSSGNTSRKMSLSTSVKGKKLPGSDESGKGSPTEGNPETSSPSENTKKSQNLPLEQSAYQSQSNDLKGAPPSQKREGYPATESSTKKTVDGDDTQKTKKADQQQKTGIPTSRKKRAFRAEAPEFVPRSQQRFSSSRDESQSSYTGSQEEATKHHHHPHRHRSSHSGEHHHFRNRHREESADTTQTSQKDSKEEKHHHFRNRRHQAKSEPNQDASKSQADGAADDNETLETADAILMPPPPSRRVSAPSDPLMANVSKARGRNRRVSRRGSNSTTQTLNESGDWSNASGIPVAVPAAPYPSPIGGPPPSHELLSTSTGASQLGRSFK